VDDECLKYKFLGRFDSAMMRLEETYGFLHKDPVNQIISMKAAPIGWK